MHQSSRTPTAGRAALIIRSLDLTGAAIAAFATNSGSRILFTAVVPMGEQGARAYMGAVLARHASGMRRESKANTGQTRR